MARKLLGGLIAVLLMIGFFLVYFSFSGYRSSSQSYWTSLSDFGFMVRVYYARLAASPPSYSDADFDSVMDRFRSSTHWDVRRQLVWTLEQWGESAAPGLRRELQRDGDPYRMTGAADALSAIGDPEAASLILAQLKRYASDPRRFRSDLVDALGDTRDPAALPVLIGLYRDHGQGLGDVLTAIGMCGGVEFLRAELDRAQAPEQIMRLIWPLAETRSPEAAAALSPLMWHADGKVRVRTYSAMGQTMGREAVAPLIHALADTQNEYVLASAINHVLGRGRNRGEPELVPFLAKYVDHPTLAWHARYALARVGDAQAVGVLASLVDREPPGEVMRHLEDLGEAALPILGRYLEDTRPAVRVQAIGVAQELLEPAVRPLLEARLADADARTRAAARAALFELDRLDLLRSFTQALPESAGRAVWFGFRSDLRWGQREGFLEVLAVLGWVHMAGLVISGLLGLLLALRRVRVFDSYRFTLFVSFLLSEGLVGNYFLLPGGEGAFMLATGVHLLLLCGFLFQERERAPGELRGRFEALGGASLWLLVPPLLVFGTPLVAEGLRLVLHDFWRFAPAIGLAALSIVFVLEQWALPWRLLPRSARLQRWLAASLMISLLLLYLRPLWLVLEARRAGGDSDGATLAALLMTPMVWMGLYYVAGAGLLRGGVRRSVPAAPPGSGLEALFDGERITVRPVPTGGMRRAAWQAVVVFASGGVAAALAGAHSAGGQGLQLALITGLVGAALAGLVFDAVLAQPRVQIRGGYARGGMTHFGAALGGARWFRNPARIPVLGNALGGGSGLGRHERTWLQRLMESSA